MPSNSDSDSDCEGGIGFMFDNIRATVLQSYTFPSSSSTSHITSSFKYPVSLNTIDDTPGAVISGHYLWPASHYLCEELSSSGTNTETDTSNIISRTVKSSRKVIELGAGCAMCSLLIAQIIEHNGLHAKVVITDHDPGVLKRAEENRDETVKSVANEGRRTAVVLKERTTFHFLNWGDQCDSERMFDEIASTGNDDDRLFDLVIGSDVIYCKEVVRPLFVTISALLSRSSNLIGSSSSLMPLMAMSQSFKYDDGTEDEIELMCGELGMEREVIWERFEAGEVRKGKVQVFRRVAKKRN